jgi:hypothetical protein
MLVYCIFAKSSFREVGLQIVYFKYINICIGRLKIIVLCSYVRDIYWYNLLHNQLNDSLITASKPTAEEAYMYTQFSLQKHHPNDSHLTCKGLLPHASRSWNKCLLCHSPSEVRASAMLLLKIISVVLECHPVAYCWSYCDKDEVVKFARAFRHTENWNYSPSKRGTEFVEAMNYKTEGRGFDARRGRWIFRWVNPSEFDSDANRNKNQGYLLGVWRPMR